MKLSRKVTLSLIAPVVALGTMNLTTANQEVTDARNNGSVVTEKINATAHKSKIKTEAIKFDKRVIKDKFLPYNIKVIVQKGHDGVRTFYQSKGTYVDSQGAEASYPIYSDEITSAPTEEVVRIGTNKTVISGISPKTIQLEREVKEKAEKAARLALQEKTNSYNVTNSSNKNTTNNSDNNSDNSTKNDSPAKIDMTNVDDTNPSGKMTSVAENKAFAKSILGERDYQCLSKIIAKESGWRTNATNPSSGAYGVPQSLPGNKMSSVGSDWKTNGKTQIKWMINYVNTRYGSPCGAWKTWQTQHWY